CVSQYFHITFRGPVHIFRRGGLVLGYATRGWLRAVNADRTGINHPCLPGIASPPPANSGCRRCSPALPCADPVWMLWARWTPGERLTRTDGVRKIASTSWESVMSHW